jgi:hypothetical protein
MVMEMIKVHLNNFGLKLSHVSKLDEVQWARFNVPRHGTCDRVPILCSHYLFLHEIFPHQAVHLRIAFRVAALLHVADPS